MKTKQLLPLLLLAVLSSYSAFSQKKKQPNILFIAVDDLRAELGTYGSEIVKSPNIDALSQNGVQFNRAYCQEAICGPSRASVMTGARNETINVIDLFQDFRENVPSIVTIPQHFKENGYETVFTGKVFHPGFTDDEMSWSRKPVKVQVGDNVPKISGGYALAASQEMYAKNKEELEAKYGAKLIRENWLDKGPALESADVPDETYDDGYNTLSAIATLNEMVKKGDKPWFLALGFKKPHLDWIAPKKYWDLYDESKIPIATQVSPPIDGASMALSESLELRVSADMPKTGEFSPELQRKLKHGYYACISYIDAQLGKMIQALKDSGEYDNTVIVLWSDHGFNLGEMGYWGKATNYEIATRVPFIISAPGVTSKSKGHQSDATVELIDLYPTLCELAGINKPAHLEGQSLVPFLKNPAAKSSKPAFSVFPTPALREWAARPFTPPFRTTFFMPLIEKIEAKIEAQMGDKWDRKTFEQFVMGYAMRTDNYRIVVWKDRRKPNDTPLYVELYDHVKDPNETVNIAKQNPKIVKELIALSNKKQS
ncbi:arylsulfatase A-like enzyme [Flavobacterium sp. 7E]|uniref:sulfatase n=1 Tax=unclassified Flavobacterium TaxID=196869 RepID=UPI00156FD46E|nr:MULTISPECIES: sulfatase [unclassified Flavobacterium]MBE0391394.1 Choline-sulfatase [Flavobacterium sp. PL002]NRS90326.1 arylsulfatase A-like enzyme [Flavobacterium sp. 7E]NRT14974.1 arylsulfatase A-like enzyme [Flavobacterium sp. 28A]